MSRNIFKRLDTVLAALKPSQYRNLWRLYNYDESKRQRYDEITRVLESVYERYPQEFITPILDRSKVNHIIAWLKQFLYKTYGYDSSNIPRARVHMHYNSRLFRDSIMISFRGIISSGSVTFNEIIDRLYQSKGYLEFRAYTSKPIDNPTKIGTNADKEYYKSLVNTLCDDFEKILSKYIGIEFEENLEDRMIGNDIAVYFEKDGVKHFIYMNDLRKHISVPDSFIQGDTLIHVVHPTEVNMLYHDVAIPIKANPKVRHLYDNLFPNKVDRLIFQTKFAFTVEDMEEKAHQLGINIDKVVNGIIDSAYRFLVEKKHMNREDVVSIERGNRIYTDFLIDGLYWYETNGKVRKINVGKILEAYRKDSNKTENMQYALTYFNTMKISPNKHYIIVLSRHPYDLAGMSTDRGWRSCMNLIDGAYKYYVPSSIAGGALIAYFCDENDTNINKPMGRVLIKPFIKNGEEKINDNPVNFKLFCSNVYGTFPVKCIKEIQEWLNENWNSRVKVSHEDTPNSRESYHVSKMMYQDPEDY